ncbi:P-loop containing nucleoside triphosphate hydrolase protein [Aspergillus sclerotiicarbonarius CBS 121057]|uniref:P-loop containing nucleoside triphosphate hydrolase protein n=1 Tax=Aspergillus sclerotiicarbonarius (strain CBS 121057 / IBT 28362) TaxID=1448318 RepID=A0A319DXR0_ASPSB|nr:P-loop containing nucleoside triphosphate hydrolase protein [Aspergillus sclerotiicarbonarius CBS 121057]
MQSRDYSRMYVIGPPGAGKGSLCTKFASEYGYHHLSVGDLLRFLCHLETLRPDIVKKIQTNALVSIEDLVPILHNVIETLKLEGKERFLIDGVPRVIDQAVPVEEAIGSPDLVLFFNCPGKIAKERFLTRKISGRVDDGETFDKRYRQYVEENARIVEYYRNRGLLVEVDTSGDVDVSYGKLVEGLRGRGWKG